MNIEQAESQNRAIIKNWENLKNAGVTIEQVARELTYRESAASGMKWDDALYQFSTKELEMFESLEMEG